MIEVGYLHAESGADKLGDGGGLVTVEVDGDQ